ncbi:hypothetical protein ACQZV8_09290 [Magnetococcales bacterium HHB-1]
MISPTKIQQNFSQPQNTATEQEIDALNEELSMDEMADFITDLPAKERDWMIEEMKKAALLPDDAQEASVSEPLPRPAPNRMERFLEWLQKR